MLEFGMGPDDVGSAERLSIAPGVDEIEAEYVSNGEADEFTERSFASVFRVLDDAVLACSMAVAVWKFLVEAGDLTPGPASHPVACTETTREEDEDAHRTLHGFVQRMVGGRFPSYGLSRRTGQG